MAFLSTRPGVGHVVVLLILLMLPASARCQPIPEAPPPAHAADEDGQPRFWLESRLNIRQGFIAASAIHASDSLDGFQLSYGIRGQSDEWPGWGDLSVFRLTGAGQEVIGVRGDMKPWPAAWQWGGLGFLLGIGLEQRREDPRSGFGGFLAVGAEFTVWSKWHWQFAVDIERDFGISSESRSQVALTIAYAHDRLTAGPDHD